MRPARRMPIECLPVGDDEVALGRLQVVIDAEVIQIPHRRC
jgi:hypothetical protein